MNKEIKESKKFTPYPTRPIRMSDKTWKSLKDKKIKSGLSWNRYLLELLEIKK